MTKHFNQLSPAEAERLALLSEELGEAQQAIGKILRHGYESCSPFDWDKISNREALERELGDCLLALDLMTQAGDVDPKRINTRKEYKRKIVRRYLHHQPDSTSPEGVAVLLHALWSRYRPVTGQASRVESSLIHDDLVGDLLEFYDVVLTKQCKVPGPFYLSVGNLGSEDDKNSYVLYFVPRSSIEEAANTTDILSAWVESNFPRLSDHLRVNPFFAMGEP